MEERTVVGRSVPRVDAVEKATGTAVYGIDAVQPRMLHGVIVRSPYPHARILRIDTSRASRLRGVKAVLTAADTSSVKLGPFVQDEFALAVDKVRYVGDEVAAVAAIDEDTAAEAAQIVKVEYELIPAVLDPFDAMEDGAPLVHEAKGNIAYSIDIRRGNVERALASADLIVSDRFTTGRQNTGYLEPLACLASWDPTGKLTVWTNFKDVFRLRMVLARFLGTTETNVRVCQTYIGGGFGSKGAVMGSIACCAALLAKKAGMPVRIVYDKDLDFVVSRPRYPSVYDLKLGFKRDGTIVAKEAHILVDAGGYFSHTKPIVTSMCRSVDSLYRFSDVHTEARVVYTNNPPNGPFRGYGNPQGTFPVECLIDVAAGKLGLDPLELRLKNATETGRTSIHGWKINSCGLRECMESVAQASNWREKKRNPQPNRGLGIACLVDISGLRISDDFYGSRAFVRINEDGWVTVISGEGDVGQGSVTTYAQIAAEELGVPFEDVRCLPVDTDVSPFCFGSYADKGTVLGGNAVRMAAQEARRKLMGLAAEVLEARPEDLVAREGEIFVRGVPDRSLTVREVARSAFFNRRGEVITGQGVYDTPSEADDPDTKHGNVSTSYVFAVQAAEVEVDPDSGQVKVLNVYSSHDAGRTVNPMGAEGQIQGAVAQGLGYALWEEVVLEEGQTMNPSFVDYRVPTSMDVPAIHATLIETNDPYGPYGAKGVGEPALTAVAPAVANAIYDAIGVRAKSLPITPEKIVAVARARTKGGE